MPEMPVDQARERAERRVICACMQDKTALVLAAEQLSSVHFRNSGNHAMFGALIALLESGAQFGPAAVIDHLQRNKIESHIDPLQAHRIEMDEGFIPPGEHEQNIELLVRRHQQDRLTAIVRQVLIDLESGPVENLDELDIHLATMDSEYRREQPGSASELVEYIECRDAISQDAEQERGLLTGFADMDKHIDLRKGQIMTIYGDTGSKKTTLAVNFVAQWAVLQKIAIYNYEQKPKEIARMIADCDKRGYIPKGNLWISPNPPPIEALPSQIRAIKIKRGLDGVVLDYIQTIPAITSRLAEDEDNLVRVIMRSMRDIAQREDIWIIVISQMRKSQSETMEHQLNPGLDRMRGSGEIKMASSIILSTVLPWKCEMRQIDGQSSEGVMMVRIKKNRECLTGNPAEEKEIRLAHSLNNRLITSYSYDLPPGGPSG